MAGPAVRPDFRAVRLAVFRTRRGAHGARGRRFADVASGDRLGIAGLFRPMAQHADQGRRSVLVLCRCRLVQRVLHPLFDTAAWLDLAWDGLMSEHAHPAPHRHRVSTALLAFALWATPAVWGMRLVANYAINSHFCFP